MSARCARLRPIVAVLALLVGPALAAPAHRTRIVGVGQYTVIFEAGLGDTLEVWRPVQSALAQGCVRTFAYNRRGYPGSQRPKGARDAESITQELRSTLGSSGVAPPYILVGHSLGGLYVQHFARRFPEEVRGLVLVDPTHWDQLERLRAEASGAYNVVRAASLLMPQHVKRELHDSASAGSQVRGSPVYASGATIILSSTRASFGETRAFRELARRLQVEIAAEYPSAEHRFVDSGHYIQRDRPAEIVSAVRSIAGCE